MGISLLMGYYEEFSTKLMSFKESFQIRLNSYRSPQCIFARVKIFELQVESVELIQEKD